MLLNGFERFAVDGRQSAADQRQHQLFQKVKTFELCVYFFLQGRFVDLLRFALRAFGSLLGFVFFPFLRLFAFGGNILRHRCRRESLTFHVGIEQA
ncbi:hypothetical protein D3C73_1020320 [compost metagenome]